VIEEKEEVLSVPKLNKFAFTSTKMPQKRQVESEGEGDGEDKNEDYEKIVPKLKKFGFSK